MSVNVNTQHTVYEAAISQLHRYQHKEDKHLSQPLLENAMQILVTKLSVPGAAKAATTAFVLSLPPPQGAHHVEDKSRGHTKTMPFFRSVRRCAKSAPYTAPKDNNPASMTHAKGTNARGRA
jgi:hypothetical protein